jgi:hypothetical protein
MAICRFPPLIINKLKSDGFVKKIHRFSLNAFLAWRTLQENSSIADPFLPNAWSFPFPTLAEHWPGEPLLQNL